MRIIVGKVMKCFEKSIIALEIPGIGLIECKETNDDDSTFLYFDLDKEQLLFLNNEIAKELLYGKEHNMA